MSRRFARLRETGKLSDAERDAIANRLAKGPIPEPGSDRARFAQQAMLRGWRAHRATAQA